MKKTWSEQIVSVYGRTADKAGGRSRARVEHFHLTDGDVVIAAITSCTNTSNPDVMIAAGLVARNAREKGITRKPWVKTSLAPGSQVVTEYLEKAGLLDDLEATGFYLVGYGCTTCIGNSGPLPDDISEAINQSGLVAASVLSGNRNFEGRISPDVKANYLASPPLVVAYALAGTVNWDPLNEPIPGSGVISPTSGRARRKSHGWSAESSPVSSSPSATPTSSRGSDEWQEIRRRPGQLYEWTPMSTYIQEPPFFQDLGPEVTTARSDRRGSGPGQGG